MSNGNGNITRLDINEDWAHSGVVEAGGYAFLSYCVGNIGHPIEAQINGAFDHLEKRLELIELNLERVSELVEIHKKRERLIIK